ncbi:MAG: hypothetical protein M1309_02210 [Actinobacteria bacterium]|nr:hypothetical protein [Actinomycetota bacterium]
MRNSGKRILVISDAVPTEKDGAAGRSWRLAEALAASQDVILAVPEVTRVSHRNFAVVFYNSWNIGMIARDSDATVCTASVLAACPSIIKAGTPVVADLPEPFPGPGPETSGNIVGAIKTADFFVCSDERSRRSWLKALESGGRVNPHTRKGDPGLRKLIDVVAVPGDGPPGGAGTVAAITPLERFCAAPRFARDRGTNYNSAKLPPKQRNGIFHRGLRRIRYRLRAARAG